MEKSVKAGISFGLTSGTITTLGLMVGLYFGTGSRLAVIGGIIIIAVADALSDSFGMHISKESEKRASNRSVWLVTFSTFSAKFFYALTFITPFLFFNLQRAVLISVIYGLLVLSILSFFISDIKKKNYASVILEHLAIAISVIVVSYFVGKFVSVVFV